MTPAVLNIAGLFLNLAGVIVLFRYGMPFRHRTEGHVYLVTEQIDEEERKAEWWYGLYGWCGLAAIVVGTVLQAAANLV